MNILIINHNGGSIYHGPNLRTYFAAKELVKLGHIVTIATSSYSHKYSVLPKVEGEVTPEEISGINFRWIRCIKYTGLFQRIFSHFQFGFKMLLNKSKICKNADLVIFSCPPPEIFIFSWILAKNFSAPIVSDIRDFWPRTQIEMSKWQYLNPYTYFLFLSQYFMFRFSDMLVSPLPGAKKYIDRVISRKEIEIIENGYDISYEKNTTELNLKVIHGYEYFGLEKTGYIEISQIKSTRRFIIGYSGSFDRDNDVESLILAARKFKDNDDVIFLLVGTGVKVNDYIRLSSGNNNIIICNRIDSKDVPTVLSVMDICYCGLKPKNIYQYGVSLAKSYEYMAAAKPIIWMIDAFNNPVQQSGGGFIIRPGDTDELAHNINRIMHMDKNKLIEMGMNNYQYLLKNHSYHVLGKKWDKIVRKFR